LSYYSEDYQPNSLEGTSSVAGALPRVEGALPDCPANLTHDLERDHFAFLVKENFEMLEYVLSPQKVKAYPELVRKSDGRVKARRPNLHSELVQINGDVAAVAHLNEDSLPGGPVEA
jgi:hypothetical protein